MPPCTEIRLGFLDLLNERLTLEGRAALDAHVGECSACSHELRSLRDAWNALPTPGAAVPPPSLGRGVHDYARRSVERAETQPAWWRNVDRPRLRAVLLGAVGALGGYVLLTAISPISDTVRICQVELFRSVPMSLGEICLVYLAVAVLYAGVPMGISAYMVRRANTWRAGLAEAGIFALLVLPTAVLQMGLEEWFITLTVLAGLLAGALAGGLGGTWFRLRRAAS